MIRKTVKVNSIKKWGSPSNRTAPPLITVYPILIKMSSPKGKVALIKTGANGNIFELVENSYYVGSGKNTKTNTNADYFDYFVKTVQIDNKVFDLIIDVEKKTDSTDAYIYTLA